MIFTRYFNRILSSAVVVTLMYSSGFPVQAQGHSGRNAKPNLDVSVLAGGTCTNFYQPADSSHRFAGLNQIKNNVSINRQLYESPFFLAIGIGGSATLTCKIDQSKYRLLKIKMGIADSDYPQTRMTVQIYQGGNVMYTHRGTPGTIIDSVLNLSDPKVQGQAHNISIEMTCHSSGYDCRLLFLQADLIHVSNNDRAIRVCFC
jgi:hypothetical protein